MRAPPLVINVAAIRGARCPTALSAFADNPGNPFGGPSVPAGGCGAPPSSQVKGTASPIGDARFCLFNQQVGVAERTQCRGPVAQHRHKSCLSVSHRVCAQAAIFNGINRLTELARQLHSGRRAAASSCATQEQPRRKAGAQNFRSNGSMPMTAGLPGHVCRLVRMASGVLLH